MGRARLSIFLVLLLALPLVGTSWPGLGASDARAEVPGDSGEILTRGFDELTKHFQDGHVARWAEPVDRSALEKVWDVPSVLGRPPYPARDAMMLVRIVKAEVDLLERYIGAGGATPGSPKEAEVREKYQKEIVHSSAFLVAASAATLEATGELASGMKPEDRSPEQVAAMDQGRHGIRDVLVGLSTELRFPIDTENKVLLIDAYAANAAMIAAYSPDADRKTYIEVAKGLLPSLSDAEKTKLQTFISAMATKDCKGFCAFKG